MTHFLAVEQLNSWSSAPLLTARVVSVEGICGTNDDNLIFIAHFSHTQGVTSVLTRTVNMWSCACMCVCVCGALWEFSEAMEMCREWVSSVVLLPSVRGPLSVSPTVCRHAGQS